MPIIRLPPKPAQRTGAFRTEPPQHLPSMRNAFPDAIHMTYDFIMHGNYVPLDNDPNALAYGHQLNNAAQQQLSDRNDDDDEYDDDEYDEDEDEYVEPCCAFDGMHSSADPKVQFLVYCGRIGTYHEITPTTHTALATFQPNIRLGFFERLIMFCGKMSDIRKNNYDAIEAMPLTQLWGSYWWNRDDVVNGMWKYYHHVYEVHNAYVKALAAKLGAPQQQQQQQKHFIPIANLNALQPNRLHMLLCVIGKTCRAYEMYDEKDDDDGGVKHKDQLEAFIFDPTTTTRPPLPTPPTPTFDLTSANFKTISIPLFSHPFLPREGEVCLVIVNGEGSFVCFYPLLHPRALLTAVEDYTKEEECYDETLPHFTPHTLDPPGPEHLPKEKEDDTTESTKSTTMQAQKQDTIVETMHSTAVDWLRQLLAFHQRQVLNVALHGLDDIPVTDYAMYTTLKHAQSWRNELEASRLKERLENKPKPPTPAPTASSPPTATTTEPTLETTTPLNDVNSKKRPQRPMGSDGEDCGGDDQDIDNNMLENTTNTTTANNNKRQKLNSDDGNDNTNNAAVHLTQQQDQPQRTAGVADETTALRLEVEQLKQQVAQQQNKLQEMEQLKQQIAQLQAGYAQLCAQKK